MKSYKKWFLTFVIFFAITCTILMTFNYIVDPFGIFGDRFFKMYNYNMTTNLRIAKIGYLDRNYNKFDSYIIGGSKSGSFLPETADKYYPGAHFYNLNMTGGRFYDYEKTIQYIVKHYKVKNIILQISQLEANKPGTSKGVTGMLHGKLVSDFSMPFYLKILFQNPSFSFDKIKETAKWTPKYEADYFYNIKNGSYNRIPQEKEIAANPETYFKKKIFFPDTETKVTDTCFDYNLEVFKRIVDFCREKKVNLLVIAAPTYKGELESYPLDKLAQFMKDIAKVTGYWNFSGYNSVNTDMKSFYDHNHFREKVGTMILARIFNDTSVKLPDDFGRYITTENAEKEINNAFHQ